MGKVEVKLSLFIDYMILYIKYPKDYTKKTVRIKEFSKVTGHKTNTQKSVVFLYTNNKKNKKTILHTMASKRINYLGINLTKDTGNNKILYKRINGKIAHVHGLKDSTPLKCHYHPKGSKNLI